MQDEWDQCYNTNINNFNDLVRYTMATGMLNALSAKQQVTDAPRWITNKTQANSVIYSTQLNILK